MTKFQERVENYFETLITAIEKEASFTVSKVTTSSSRFKCYVRGVVSDNRGPDAVSEEHLGMIVYMVYFTVVYENVEVYKFRNTEATHNSMSDKEMSKFLSDTSVKILSELITTALFHLTPKELNKGTL
jgi:hypothetical protein